MLEPLEKPLWRVVCLICQGYKASYNNWLVTFPQPDCIMKVEAPQRKEALLISEEASDRVSAPPAGNIVGRSICLGSQQESLQSAIMKINVQR